MVDGGGVERFQVGPFGHVGHHELGPGVPGPASAPRLARAAAPTSGRRPQNTTVAPSAWRRWTTARPMPVVPPVTTATRPSNRPFTLRPARGFGVRRQGSVVGEGGVEGGVEVDQRGLDTAVDDLGDGARGQVGLDPFHGGEVLGAGDLEQQVEVLLPVALGLLGGGGFGGEDRGVGAHLVDGQGFEAPHLNVVELVDDEGVGHEEVLDGAVGDQRPVGLRAWPPRRARRPGARSTRSCGRSPRRSRNRS